MFHKTDRTEQEKRGSRRLEVYTRWIILRDLAEVVAIDRDSYELSWDVGDFLDLQQRRPVIGFVAEEVAGFDVVGFILYELQAGALKVLRLAVHPDYRRRQVGTRLIERLVERMKLQRRRLILLTVQESNVAGQQFLKACGFKATEIERGRDEDGYLMVFNAGGDE